MLARPIVDRLGSSSRLSSATARELVCPLVIPLTCGTSILGTLPDMSIVAL
jgi:hypothetical protein